MIKLDQIGFPHQSKNVTIKSSHIFDFFGSDLSKMDQTGSNWISHQFKKATKKVVALKERVKMTVLFLIFFLIRSVQNGSNSIKFDFSAIEKC